MKTSNCPWCHGFELTLVIKHVDHRMVAVGLTDVAKRHLQTCAVTHHCPTCGCRTGSDEESCTVTRCWCVTQTNVNEWHPLSTDVAPDPASPHP